MVRELIDKGLIGGRRSAGTGNRRIWSFNNLAIQQFNNQQFRI